MQVDWRIGVLIIVVVLAILLVAGLAGGARPGTGDTRDSGGPPACPPGHVTSQGCTKP